MGGRVLTVIALLASSWSVAHGHVAPSTSTNNRYIKLTPMGDRVRLAYTVYMGEVPGAQARPRMDANKDGTLDEKEADAYGQQVAAAVQGALLITLDGVAQKVRWEQVHVGLGTPVTSAGAFSIDLVAWFCVAKPSKPSTHRFELRDQFRIPKPGEMELRVDESPGVKVIESRVGEVEKKPQLQYTWSKSPRALAETPFKLGFEVTTAAVFAPDKICAPSPEGKEPKKGKSNLSPIITVVGGAILLIGMGIWAVRKGAI